MEIFAPLYYKNFKCIASGCKHSCCVGWQIEVDRVTCEKYLTLKGDYAQKIRESLTKKNPRRFKMTKNKRCPHFDEKGLCKIILNYGEDFLCEICREHPRFYNRTARGLEVGVGISCPTACELVLTSDGYDNFTKVGEVDSVEDLPTLDCLAFLTEIFKITADRSTPLSNRFDKIEKLYGVSLGEQSDERWRKIINALEYLHEDRKVLFLNFSTHSEISNAFEKQIERAFAYFIYRHLPTAQNKDEFRKTLGFCLFCTGLLISLINFTNAKTLDEIIDLAVTVSEEIEYSLDNKEQILSAFTRL